DTYRSTAWSRGHLEFLSQDLERVIRDINRYTHRKIAIKDPRVASMQFSGTVDIQHVNEWLQGIEKVFPIETVHNNSGGLDIYLAEHALNGP
ncbi:MAG: hypothetical protein OIF34_12930, partial [Porticoccaceae bacterium]|nr:hypothetical protein [Porticoccaceae bacterium]